MRRALLAWIVIGCGSRGTPAPSGSLDGWVIDRDGPVAGAEVKLLGVAPASCPCAPSVVDRDHNVVPECACPAALASWRERLGRCTPPPTIAKVTTDAHGAFALPLRGAGVLEVSARGGARWTAVPEVRSKVSLELGELTTPRFAITFEKAPVAALTGAVLTADGHCVPLRRDGDEWVPETAVPKTEGVIIVDTPGRALMVRPFEERVRALELHRDAITGECPQHADEVRLDNGVQELVAKARGRRFTITGALDMPAMITCWVGGTAGEQLSYEPGEPVVELTHGEWLDERPMKCSEADTVEVVDGDGRPIAGATMNLIENDQNPTRHGVETNARGTACVHGLWQGGELVVYAPHDSGAWCAGDERVNLLRRSLSAPRTRVTLRLRPVGRVRWTGRVVTPEGMAVPGAIVTVRDVSTKLPANAELCQMTVDARAETALDGTFSIELPPGKATLVVHHAWYLQHDVPIAVPSPPRKIVMNRGVRWTGRLRDPDGAPIERCHIFARLPVGGLVTGTCGPSGFTLRPVPPGATLHATVRITEPPLGQRAMRHAITIGGDDHVADIRWPPGDTIAGVVVDSKGNPKPEALLMVVPNNSGAEHDPAMFDAVLIEADANGAFAFRHLKPGMWKLRGDRLESKQAALVVSTGTSDVRFVVPK